MKTLGQVLLEKIQEKNVTLVEVARVSGIKIETLIYMLRDEALPDNSGAQKLAKYFNTDKDFWLKLSEQKNNGNRIMKTHVIMVLDSSGSMEDQVDAVISGFNEFVEEQTKGKDEAFITLYTFNNEVKKRYEEYKAEDTPKLSELVYRTGGTTALMDAAATAILENQDKEYDQTICVFMTDGFENASRLHNREKVNSLITDLEKSNWEFVFMASGQNAWLTAKTIGVRPGHTLSFGGSQDATRDAFTSVSKGIYSKRMAYTTESKDVAITRSMFNKKDYNKQKDHGANNTQA